MNKLNLFEPAYFFPYVALAARYKEDSGDNDGDPWDFIDDLVEKWLPGALVTKMPVTDKLDFSYSIEHENKLCIVNLGTEGGLFEPGWVSDFSPQIERQEFHDLGGHVDFIKAGVHVGKFFADKIDKYQDNFYIVGHSRNRTIPAARWALRELGAMPRRIIPYCTPPVFVPSAADEYDKSGLGAVTIRPVMYNDPVDSIGIPLLKHVGIELKLPKVRSDAIRKRGLIGRMVMGHAYSSVFDALYAYCKARKMGAEMKWIDDTRWVAKI
jgi:hypothetical protein